MLTLLTATGMRPKAWAICEKLMQAQTYTGPVHWIIVDDGETPQPVQFQREGWRLTVVRPTPYWKPGDNTQARNLKAGMEFVEDNAKLVCIEDDDGYAPAYLENVDRWLDQADLVGEKEARYYNLPYRKYRYLTNTLHASLCSTAMKGMALDAFRRELKPGVQYIDLNLWRNFTGPKKLYGTKLVVGMKGLPGRGGIGMGHRREFAGKIDKDGAVLRQWLGEAAKLYEGV
jgi:hypothetical protein